jgi:hypothetical protein
MNYIINISYSHNSDVSSLIVDISQLSPSLMNKITSSKGNLIILNEPELTELENTHIHPPFPCMVENMVDVLFNG